MVQIISKGTLQDKVYKSLKGSRLKNEFLPGEELSMEQLTQDLGVSPTPVREALAQSQLSADGLIEQSRNKSARVAEITEKDIHQTYEARRLLEPYSTRFLVNKLRDDHNFEERLQDFKKKAKKIQKVAINAALTPSQYEIYLDIDLQLQQIILQAVENTLLKDILTLVSDHSLRIRSFVEVTSKPTLDKIVRIVNKEHLEIIESLLDKDASKPWQQLKNTLLMLRNEWFKQFHKLKKIE